MKGKDLVAVKDLIKDKVRMETVLAGQGIEVMNGRETQISCPFHGDDKSPSARFYPDTDSIHCFTCKETWDVISFEMTRQGLPFRDTLSFLVGKYKISTTALPDAKKKWNVPKTKATAPTIDKKALLFIKLEEKIKQRVKAVPVSKYATWVFLLSGLRKLDEGPEFNKIASSLIKSIKKVSV